MSFLRGLTTIGRIGLTSKYQTFQKPKLLLNQSVRCVTLRPIPATPPPQVTHEEKNEGVRPMSPHLLIYKPQLTSMMSISHRITGMAITGYATILAISSFMTYDMMAFAETIHSWDLSWVSKFIIKYILAFPVSYHLWNGIRHLVWDMGKGFSIKEVYMTGYIVLALSVLLSIILAK